MSPKVPKLFLSLIYPIHMKKLFAFSLISLVCACSAFAQSSHMDINTAHHWNYLDRDLELSLERFFNKNGVQLSLHYFQNTAESDMNWQDKPRATNFSEHIGWSLAYLRYLPLSESNVELYPYLKVTGFRLPYQSQNEQNGLFSEPASWKFYSALGVQVKCKLYRKLYLSAGADAGARWDQSLNTLGGPFNGLAATGFVGLAYRIKS